MLGWELPPHNSGGLGVACYFLCKALSERGADIEFILPYTADHNVDFMHVNSVSPHDAATVQAAVSAYDSYKYVKKDGTIEWLDIFDYQSGYDHEVEKIAEQGDYDVIHAHDWLTFRAGLRAKQKSGLPLVLHVHSVERDRAGGNPGNPLVREVEQLSMQLADRVVAVSEHTKKMIVKDYGIPADKIEVVHNSLNLAEVEPLSGDNVYRYLTKMKAEGYRVVVNIGRLTIQKGLFNFLQAAKEVVSHAPKTLFLIVGSGEQERELLLEAAELGIGKNVIFTGFQRGKNWRDAFAIGDLFVMPSVSEPFGLTPLEAAGYGTPSMISKQSGVAEVLRNALKVDFWDINEMANQITSVVRSDALRDELHRNVFKEYERLTWDHAAGRLMSLYRQHTEPALV